MTIILPGIRSRLKVVFSTMTEMRVSNPLYGNLLFSFDFRNVSAALEPNSDLLKIQDLVFVRLEQFVSLIGLPSFLRIGM